MRPKMLHASVVELSTMTGCSQAAVITAVWSLGLGGDETVRLPAHDLCEVQ